ncbi:MAG: VWA domain-containing protein [Myxococcales bacterium]|nr:VWA domain-containing protein [Myxococcales bacterium]
MSRYENRSGSFSLLALLALLALTALPSCGQKQAPKPTAKVTGAATTDKAPATKSAARPLVKPAVAKPAVAKPAVAKPAVAKPGSEADQRAKIEAARAAARKRWDEERNKPEKVGDITLIKRKVGAWQHRVLPGTPTKVTRQIPDPKRPKGTTDDNANFAAFSRYIEPWKKKAPAQFKYLKVSDQRLIKVVDVKGVAVPMAVIDVAQAGKVVWRARTFGDGRMYFYPSMIKSEPGQPWAVGTVELASRARGVLAPDAKELTLKLPGTQHTASMQYDIAVVVDTTASMAPVLKVLRNSLLSALKRLDAIGVKIDLKIGAVAYRDQGEDYLTKMLDMSGDLNAFLREMSALKASGGGDAEDALDQGLNVALTGLTWRRTSAKTLFILTDAPPKPAIAGDIEHTSSAIRAAALGIRVHSLAIEGHNERATLSLRQLSQMSRGWFFPIPKGAAASLEKTLANAMFGRLKAEVDGWTKIRK